MARLSQAAGSSRYGVFNSMKFRWFDTSDLCQLYAKLQAYAGQRLNQPTLEQAAWDFINNNTTGVYPPAISVGGSDVLNPVMEVSPTVSNHRPSNLYPPRLRIWLPMMQPIYLFRSMLYLLLRQTLLPATPLLARTMMMIQRSQKWEIYHLVLWSWLKET